MTTIDEIEAKIRNRTNKRFGLNKTKDFARIEFTEPFDTQDEIDSIENYLRTLTETFQLIGSVAVVPPALSIDEFTGNGRTKEFKTSKKYSAITEVYVNGVKQYAGTQFQEVETKDKIIFIHVPLDGSIVRVIYT